MPFTHIALQHQGCLASVVLLRCAVLGFLDNHMVLSTCVRCVVLCVCRAIFVVGGNFDKADRLFSDIASVWENASGLTGHARPVGDKGSLQDVKELIPEWYSMPAIFKNSNRFDLGRTQEGFNSHRIGFTEIRTQYP